MTPLHLVLSIITVLWIKGADLSKEKQVFQTPAELFVNPNGEVNMSLRHEIPTYNTVLWYHRSPGDTSLKLVAFITYKTATVEPSFQSRFKVSGDGQKMVNLHLLKVTHPEDSGEYLGAAGQGYSANPAYFGGGTKLTVLEQGRTVTKPTVKVLRPSPNECRNHKDDVKKKTIVCVASRFYPDHVQVSWEVDGHKVTAGVATDNGARREGDYYTITSRLRVPATDWFTEGKNFTCIVSFYDGENTETFPGSVFGETSTDGGMTRDTYLRRTQSAKLSYGVFIVKSSIYGAFVAFLVWKLQSSAGKQNS